MNINNGTLKIEKSCVLLDPEIVSQNDIDFLLQSSNTVKYDKGDIIFKQTTRATHLMCLKSGLVKIYKESNHNKVLIIKLAQKNELIGLLSAFSDDNHQYSAAAVELTEVVFFDIHAVKKVVSRNGKLGLELLKMSSLNGLYIFGKMMDHHQKQLPGRIADVLLYFAETIYKSPDFTFPMTRRELAELAGTTKESFIRTLTEFKNDRIIDMNGKKVSVQSFKILRKLSEIG